MNCYYLASQAVIISNHIRETPFIAGFAFVVRRFKSITTYMLKMLENIKLLNYSELK